jgi:hypothetical protein
MTLPPRTLIRLHLRARQTDRAALALVATAAALRASQHWTAGSGLFPKTILLLLSAAAATAVATGTGNPFGEIEHTASSPLPMLRLTHLLTLTCTALAVTALAGLTATYTVSGAALLRNLAGFTGIALLTAALLGTHVAWTVPLGYVLYCAGDLDLRISNLSTWPTRPDSDRVATAAAVVLLAAGLAAVTLTGARDRRSERS